MPIVLLVTWRLSDWDLKSAAAAVVVGRELNTEVEALIQSSDFAMTFERGDETV